MDVVATQQHIDIRGAARRCMQASIEESNAVRMVMRLVRTRIMRDPLDARRSLLSLAEGGERLYADLSTRVPRVQKALTQRLPPLAVDEFHRLTRLVARL